MKKLSAVLVVLVMLGICTSSYGYLLVYNLSGVIRGANNTTGVTIPFKGYLVMGFNKDTDAFVDSNIIIYGKDSGKNKVFVQLNSNGDNQFLSPAISYRTVKTFYELNGESLFDFRATMMGNLKLVKIGLASPKLITPSLKGVITSQEGMLLGLDQEIAGIGNISASLYTALTRTVNQNPGFYTQDDVIAMLRVVLQSKEYSPMNEGDIPVP